MRWWELSSLVGLVLIFFGLVLHTVNSATEHARTRPDRLTALEARVQRLESQPRLISRPLPKGALPGLPDPPAGKRWEPTGEWREQTWCVWCVEVRATWPVWGLVDEKS